VGKESVALSWLGEVTFVLKEFPMNCLKFSLINFGPTSTLKFLENGGKTLGPAD
jgi:hypothetical protein